MVITMRSIREIRENLNLSQEQVARLANISLHHYFRIEKGINRPNVHIAIRLSKIFNTSIEELFPDFD